MKRILFPTLLIATLLAGGLVAFAIWRQSPASAEDYLKSGKQYYEEKNFKSATLQFLNAVQLDDRNKEARYLLALSYLNQGDVSGAAKQLRTLLEYYPDETKANLELGKIYLGFAAGDPRAFEEASKIAETVLKTEPKNVDALILSGNAAANLRNYEESVQQFEKAANLDPENAVAFLGLGATQTARKNFPEAEQAFEKARELDPKGKGVLLSLANYYFSVNELKKAEEFYKTSWDLFPSDPSTYFGLTKLYLQEGRFDEAVSLLREAQIKNPKDPRPSFVLSDLLMTRSESDARQVLLDLKKQLPDNLDVAAKIAVSYMAVDPARARTEIDQILKERPKHPAALALLGQHQLTTGQLDAAKATLSDPLVLDSRLEQVHYLLGVIDARQEQRDSAEAHYRKALELRPDYLLARSALVGVLIDKGRIADARVEIKRVTDADKNYVPGRLMKAAVDISEKRYAEAELELNALVKERPSDPDVQRELGIYYSSIGRIADAEKALVRSLEIQPDSIQHLQELVRFYVQSKQPEKAIQRLSAIPEDKKRSVHYEALGAVYSQMGKASEAEAAYTKALEKDPKSSADASIAGLYIQSGRLEDGLKKLDELIKKNPGNSGAYAIKGVIYDSQGKTADAKEAYSRALQIDGTLDAAANNLAYLLAEEGRELETALTWAQSARRRQPNLPGIADTLGWVYYKLGNHSLARDQLQFALSKEPDNPVFQYHLGMIYLGNKQTKEAADAFRKAVNNPKSFKEKPLAQAALKEVTK